MGSRLFVLAGGLGAGVSVGLIARTRPEPVLYVLLVFAAAIVALLQQTLP